MKKFLLPLLVVFFISCNVSKLTSNVVVLKAKEGQTINTEKYINDKLDICKYLAPSDEQKIKLEKLFTEEKTELNKIDKYDDQSFARNIYKYETEFRNILNEEQLKMYKEMRSQFEDRYFYSQYSLNSIKKSVMRI